VTKSVKILIRDELVFTAGSERVKLRSSPEATPDVSGHRVPCEEREVPLFKTLYRYSEMRMAVDSVTADLA